MTGIYDSRPKFEHADPDKLKIPKITSEKEPLHEFSYKSRQIRSEVLLKIYLSQLLEHHIEKSLNEAKAIHLYDNSSLSQTLKKIKFLFQKLKAENTSRDFRFTEELSKHWHVLLLILEALTKTTPTPRYLGNLQLLLKNIDTHPKKNDHPLGHYLTLYAGEKWLPFPLMDILSDLHEDALSNRTKSTLHDWILTLSIILEDMKAC